MKKRVISMILVVVMGAVFLAGCTDSSPDNIVQDVDYDPVAEVAKYELNELSDYEKDYKIKMGYYNCDHMVAAVIGEEAGIYEALGLDVELIQTHQVVNAMASGEMDAGYQWGQSAIMAVNEGAPLFMAAANHLGGSRYLVVSNDIETPQDLIGKTLAISADAEVNPEWIKWTEELDIPLEAENYNIIEMGQKDAAFALKAGQLDGFASCDPWASQAEIEGFGKIIATGWGYFDPEESTGSLDDWGMCCVYSMQNEFAKECPELARRLVIAHGLAVEYLYTHPYNAGLMFAKAFDVEPEVGIRTVYMKTVAEGRTITWRFSEQNLENFEQNFKQYDIPEEDIPEIENMEKLLSVNLIDGSVLGDFETFIKEEVDPVFPLGDSYEDWLEKAKSVDGIV